MIPPPVSFWDFIMMLNVTVSKSRTYVAICLTKNGGYCFRKFHLPEPHINDSNEASYYYWSRHRKDPSIQASMAIEDYNNLEEEQND